VTLRYQLARESYSEFAIVRPEKPVRSIVARVERRLDGGICIDWRGCGGNSKETGLVASDVTGASASPLVSVNYVRSQYLAGNQRRHDPTQNDLFSRPLLTQLLAQRRNQLRAFGPECRG
jgi:hypothetical protein